MTFVVIPMGFHAFQQCSACLSISQKLQAGNGGFVAYRLRYTTSMIGIQTGLIPGLTSFIFALFTFVVTAPAYSGDYQKCVDPKGNIYLSNKGCPSTSEKSRTYRMEDTPDSEYQEMELRNQETRRREQARQQIEAQWERFREKQRLLNECLAEADERYQKRWEDTCLFGGSAKGCALNIRILEDYDRSREAQRNECYFRFQ